MNKVNKFFVGLAILFVALQLSSTYAVEGDGSRASPYIIGSSTTTEIECEKVPFYFTVTSDAVYTVEYNALDKKAIFTKTNSVNVNGGKTDLKVMLSEADFASPKNFQLGITPVKESEIAAITPEYNIQELATYTTNDGNGIRTTSLKNVMAGVSGVNAPKSDLYFFATSRGKENAGALFTSIGYEQKGSSNGEWIQYVYRAEAANLDGFAGVDMGTTTTSVLDSVSLPSPSNSSVSGNAINIVYQFKGNTNTALDDTQQATAIEELITRLMISFGDMLMNMLQNILGYDLTIDSLIFNTFEPTKIDIYNASETSNINTTIRNVVNNWFNIFSYIAYIGYLIIFVYIGIAVVMSAGTSKADKTKAYIGNWVLGLVFLLFIPTYGVKTIISINDAFVKFMSKDRQTIETYYNIYDPTQKNDILGSDSATVTIEELVALREQLENEIQVTSGEVQAMLDDAKTQIKASIGARYEPGEEGYVNDFIQDFYEENYIEARSGVESKEQAKIKFFQDVRTVIERATRNEAFFSTNTANALNRYFSNDANMEAILSKFEEIYQKQMQLEEVNAMIEIKENDLMGIMRSYAGHYHRIIFALIWYMLFFQLVALTFLYFKRLFMIAILIAIFPIIMLFYCIDKMADGQGQTLKLWFNELLANIFVQSVHAIIYTVIVEMGLNVYKNDPSDWILFAAAMLFLLPAESILKEIFNLRGSTLRQIGGMFGKTIAAGLALNSFRKSWRTGKDKGYDDSKKSFKNRLQNSQDRADNKSAIRRARAALNSDGKMHGWDKFREGAYKVGTGARKVAAKAATPVAGTANFVRSTTGIAIGGIYAAANGDVKSLTEGAAIASVVSGSSGKKISKEKVKMEVKSAYENKNKKS